MCRAIASAVLVVALTASPRAWGGAHPPWVTVDVAPCRSHTRLGSELEAHLESIRAAHPDLTVDLSARPDELPWVTVKAASGGRIYSRALRVSPGDCEGLARSAALLVQGWLKRPWKAMTRAILEQQAAAQREVQTLPPRASIDLEPLPQPGWALTLLGGVFAEPDQGHAGPSAALLVGKGLSPRVGLALLGGWDGAVSRAAGSGVVSLQVSRVALLGRWTLPEQDGDGRGARLDLLAGPSLQVLRLSSRGYPFPRGASRYSDTAVKLAGTAIARGQYLLTRRLAISAALEVSVRPDVAVIRVEQQGRVLALSPVRAGLLVGASMRFD